MGTVTIGGRELAVKQQGEPGGLGLLKKTTLASQKLAGSTPETYPDNAADLVLCYVGHNDGVTAEWLQEQLPADVGEVLRAYILASGGKVSEGEAQRP